MNLARLIPPFGRRPAFWWGIFGVWFVLLFALSSISSAPTGIPYFMWSDKFAHAIYFTAGSMALFWALGLPGARFESKWLLALVACIAAAALVGWFDEWHQTHTPGRSGNDLGDWIADVVGGILGALLGKMGLRWLAPDPERPACRKHSNR